MKDKPENPPVYIDTNKLLPYLESKQGFTHILYPHCINKLTERSKTDE